MLGIVRPTDRHGLRGGPRRDQSRLDPPYGTLPRSPQPEMRARRRDRTEEDSTLFPGLRPEKVAPAGQLNENTTIDDTGLEKRANFDRLERATWDVSFLVLIFQVREEFVSFFVSFLTRALNAQMLSSSRSQSTLRWIDERSRLRPAATMKLRKSPLSHIIYNFICLNIIK
jgi:hypothetical protein